MREKICVTGSNSVEFSGNGAKSITMSTGSIDFSDPDALQKFNEMLERREAGGKLETTVTITADKPISVTTQTVFKANGQPTTRITTSETPDTSNTNVRI